jgi:hypothetical protein
MVAASGCSQDAEDIPFLLAPGVDGSDFTMTRDGDWLVVGGAANAIAIGLQGARHPHQDLTDATRISALGDGRLVVAPDVRIVDGPSLGMRATDVAAACDGTIWIAAADGLHTWHPTAAELHPFGPRDSGMHGVTFAGCEKALAWGTLGVAWVFEESTLNLPVRGEVFAAAASERGLVAIAHSDPPLLSIYVVDSPDGRVTLRSRASLPTVPRALAFGFPPRDPDQLFLLEPTAITVLRP